MAEELSTIELILYKYLYKEDVQDIAEELGVAVSGTKEDIVDRILEDEDFDPEDALAYLDKEQFVNLCEELELSPRGTRDDLWKRVLKQIEDESREEDDEEVKQASAAREPARPAPPSEAYHQPGSSRKPLGMPQQESPLPPPTDQVPPRALTYAPPPQAVPLEFPETQPPSLIPEARATLVTQLQLISEFIESYRPSRRFANEQAYEIEVAQALRGKFGDENVRTQVTIYGGRIDIEVLGVGIEIKVPASRSALQTLLGQISIYRNSYGQNLMVLIFNDLGKHQDVTEFASILRGRGIPVFVK